MSPNRGDSRPADAPALSLVVASRGDARTLRALLAEVLPLAAAHGVEVVVARAGGAEETAALAREAAGARFVPAPADATPGALRFTGMAEATGDVVMLAADDDPAARERLDHFCRTLAPHQPAGEPQPAPLPAPPAFREPEGGAPLERAGRPRWAASVP